MPIASIQRWGTAMPQSEVKEVVSQWTIATGYYIVPETTSANAYKPVIQDITGNAAASVTRFMVIKPGGILQIATGQLTFTGINVATGAFALVGAYAQSAGTLAVVAGTAGATINAVGLPVIPSTAFAFGMIVIGGGATAFTGGTTALDATNAGAIMFDIDGPSAIALSTGPITTVPG